MTSLSAASINRRLLALNDALRELERPGAAVAAELLKDRVLKAAVERWMQVAVEACVDLAYERIAAERWTPPETAREAFMILAAKDIIPPELAKRLGLAVGLRNIIVHDYVSLDVERIATVVGHDLQDLRSFAAIVAQWAPQP